MIIIDQVIDNDVFKAKFDVVFAQSKIGKCIGVAFAAAAIPTVAINSASIYSIGQCIIRNTLTAFLGRPIRDVENFNRTPTLREAFNSATDLCFVLHASNAYATAIQIYGGGASAVAAFNVCLGTEYLDGITGLDLQQASEQDQQEAAVSPAQSPTNAVPPNPSSPPLSRPGN
jgi:hypothetical protein